MTNKKIIINGIDVSGCVHYFKDCCTINGFIDCKVCPTCYYKQCKRKEDLINKIEDTIEPYQTEIEAEAFSLPTAIKSILERKEQECERLKQGYAELTDIVAPYMDDFTGYNEELGGFDIVLCVKQLLERLDQFKQANDEKNELLAQLGCPTVATARRLTLSLKEQLDQLKAELEQYKNLAEHNGRVCNERLDKIDELEHDINELKAENILFRESNVNLAKENEKLKKAEEYDSRYNDMQAEIDCGERMIKKLKATLQEIKEIAEIENNDIKVLYNRRTYQRMKQILQKISEVEDEI